MHMREVEVDVRIPEDGQVMEALSQAVKLRARPVGAPSEVPVRFVVTGGGRNFWHCEVGMLMGDDRPAHGSIFEGYVRALEYQRHFTVALVVPTGVGAEIGGHAGDASPVARLLAGVCDTLVTHPNVVNASDINELPTNGLYVEGSILSRLLMGTVGLNRVRSNRVCLVVADHEDSQITDYAINSVSAARAAMGMDCPLVVKMGQPFEMRADYTKSGRAVGAIEGLERLCKVLTRHRDEFDAVALASVIRVPEHLHTEYYTAQGEIVNPWGGVEAMLTHAISLIYDVPCAHAPMVENKEILEIDLGVVDPRMAAETISTSFLFCVLKGLHRSPRIVLGGGADRPEPGVLTAADISCLVIPDGCLGLPVFAALQQGIPVIAVRGTQTRMVNDFEALPFAAGKLWYADGYLEAAGILAAMRAGVAPDSVRRPLAPTNVVHEESG